MPRAWGSRWLLFSSRHSVRESCRFTFTAQSKSRLGFELLAAVNSGRLKMYAGDGSPEYQEFWCEIEKAKSQYRPNQTMNFFVDPSRGHDDFLMSLALVMEAANGYEPREAKGNLETETLNPKPQTLNNIESLKFKTEN